MFLGKPAPEGCKVPAELLARMRREFEYWYPWDLRVSGKVRRSRMTTCKLGACMPCTGHCLHGKA